MFLDFFDEPTDSPRRNRNGIYETYTYDFGPNKQVRVILLDLRYNKDRYNGRRDPSGDFLGEEQWIWFERVLRESSAQVHLIGSSIQTLPELREIGETWSRFPSARQRLFDLFAKTKVRTPILLSGDVHFSEVNMAHCTDTRSDSSVTNAWNLLEVTCSGLTHSWGYIDTRYESKIRYLLLAGMYIFQAIIPLRYQAVNDKGISELYLERAFGELHLDWDAQNVTVRIFGVASSDPVIERTVAFSQLGNHKHEGDITHTKCEPHRGQPHIVVVSVSFALTFLVMLSPFVLIIFCVVKAIVFLFKKCFGRRRSRAEPKHGRRNDNKKFE
eukprot:c8394_g1_i1.p1 GENE.c8394_g1_i1~~c8394_g1_i1.p1  ORF type:complete len:328 (-),score=75.28 c8394_g1_i1:232-1215(-)